MQLRKELTMLLKNEMETESFGAWLWTQFPKTGVIFLHGELGSGKTTIVRGLLRAAGHNGAVKSPTFTVVENYHLQQRDIFHFDLYRLVEAEELEWLGIRDYFASNTLCLIEWAERGYGYLPQADVEIYLQLHPQGRELRLESHFQWLKNS
ncbi:MAG: tRNA ((37)-N6)-threonylcarbamoyltransferase complex ATPase subunit type 1 TsaE [Pseudomonadota bacterium]|jgi:tRNA threonylcarbamoyladenosine biosynthesis protein TsaE